MRLTTMAHCHLHSAQLLPASLPCSRALGMLLEAEGISKQCLLCVFVQSKGGRSFVPPVPGFLLALHGIKEPWDAGDLIPLISPPHCGVQPGLDTTQVRSWDPHSASVTSFIVLCLNLQPRCISSSPPPAAAFFLRTSNSLPAFCFHGPERTFVFYLRK